MADDPDCSGMAARTAVVAGTATAVSNNVSRRQAGRQQDKEMEAAEQQQMLVDQAAAQAAAQMQAQQAQQAGSRLRWPRLPQRTRWPSCASSASCTRKGC